MGTDSENFSLRFGSTFAFEFRAKRFPKRPEKFQEKFLLDERICFLSSLTLLWCTDDILSVFCDKYILLL